MAKELKIKAAAAALELVQDGMLIGIGSGSTADEFSILLGAKVKEGLSITGVPTSENTRKLCESLSIPLATLEQHPKLDLVIDGADEVDAKLQLIKGGGGALLREKIVASASQSMIVIADESKLVETLGKYPLPIEVNQFGLAVTWFAIEQAVKRLGLPGNIVQRKKDGENFITDGGHYILDASFGHIPDAPALSTALLEVPGVVEHGLFLGYASSVFLAGKDGVRRLDAPHVN